MADLEKHEKADYPILDGIAYEPGATVVFDSVSFHVPDPRDEIRRRIIAAAQAMPRVYPSALKYWEPICGRCMSAIASCACHARGEE